MSAPLISPLPTPPSTSRPSTFPTEGDTFLAALPNMRLQMNALATWMQAGTFSELVGSFAEGAAFQHGINSNGEYVWFQSGHAIAWHLVTLTYSVNSTLQAVWSFPVAFDAAPGAWMTPQNSNITPTLGELSQFRAQPVTATNATLALNRSLGATNFEVGDTFNFYGMAVGRKTA